MKRITKSRVLIVVLFAVFAFGCEKQSKSVKQDVVLPYYNEATFTPKWFDSEADVPPNFHQIRPFELVNQNGEKVSASTTKEKIYVTKFFFTSCPGICPKLTSNMSLIQEAVMNDEEILLLSHSATPSYDSVWVLKDYAERHGVITNKWHLLTGDRAEIYDLGRNQYFVEERLGLEKDPDDFIHTENFILVDQNRHIRGIYNGLNKTSVNQLISDIDLLKKAS